VKERPMLFSGPMVRAILGGHKTQTRRIVKPQPSDTFLPQIGEYQRTLTDRKDGEQFPDSVVRFGASDENEDYPCPYGQPGDRLWVRETFRQIFLTPAIFQYRADNGIDADHPLSPKWKPSIFCTRAASRITLEITAVRIERLNEISEADARAEGCPLDHLGNHYDPPPKEVDSWQGYGRYSYSLLWSKINGPGSWDANPWVWVIEFRRVKP